MVVSKVDPEIMELIYEFSSIANEHERRTFLVERMGANWGRQLWETMEALRALSTGMTSGEIAELTGFKASKIRAMSERGEMPAPAYRGQWWYWHREEIDAWWAEYQTILSRS